MVSNKKVRELMELIKKYDEFNDMLIADNSKLQEVVEAKEKEILDKKENIAKLNYYNEMQSKKLDEYDEQLKRCEKYNYTLNIINAYLFDIYGVEGIRIDNKLRDKYRYRCPIVNHEEIETFYYEKPKAEEKSTKKGAKK